jgi:hypothetical protein
LKAGPLQEKLPLREKLRLLLAQQVLEKPLGPVKVV